MPSPLDGMVEDIVQKPIYCFNKRINGSLEITRLGLFASMYELHAPAFKSLQ